MTFATLAVLALVLAAPAPKKHGGAKPRARPGAAAALAKRQPLAESDVRRLLREWEAFNGAMAGLQDAVPAIPSGGGSGDDLAQAEAAWAVDARIRRTLQSAGTTPEAFLALYRNVAEAWWALVESEARESTAAGFRREIDALKKSENEDTTDVVAELERGLEVLDTPRQDSPDLEVVKRFRADLGRIFSPEAAGP